MMRPLDVQKGRPKSHRGMPMLMCKRDVPNCTREIV